MQAYSDTSRENDPHALPDLEVFYMNVRDFVEASHDTWMAERTLEIEPSQFSNLTDCSELEGWYWWICYPGCLPDSNPIGPFDTENEALADARLETEEF